MVMRTEFESDIKLLQVYMTLRGLRIERVFSENEDVINETDALNCIVKRINKLATQCTKGFGHEENKDTVFA